MSRPHASRTVEGTQGATRARRAADRRVRGQAGLTLPESLIALFLVSTMILALAVGMFTFMRTTRSTSEAQRRQAELTRLAESVKAEQFVACGGATDPADAYSSAVSPASVTVTVEHESAAGIGTFSATCPSPDTVQRVTLDYDGTTAQVVKRAEDPTP